MYEVNRRLVDHPELIATLGDTEGYIAIIMPKRDEKKTATEKLLTQAQYNSRPPFPNALVNAVGVQE
jgi:glycine cleavage system H lipoate-binding protein